MFLLLIASFLRLNIIIIQRKEGNADVGLASCDGGGIACVCPFGSLYLA